MQNRVYDCMRSLIKHAIVSKLFLNMFWALLTFIGGQIRPIVVHIYNFLQMICWYVILCSVDIKIWIKPWPNCIILSSNKSTCCCLVGFWQCMLGCVFPHYIDLNTIAILLHNIALHRNQWVILDTSSYPQSFSTFFYVIAYSLEGGSSKGPLFVCSFECVSGFI